MPLLKKKLFEEAIKFIMETIKITDKLEDSDEKSLLQAEAFLLNANVNLKAKNYTEALNYFDKSTGILFAKKMLSIIYTKIHKGKLLCFSSIKSTKANLKRTQQFFDSSGKIETKFVKTIYDRQAEPRRDDAAISNTLDQKNPQKPLNMQKFRGRSFVWFR